MGREVRISDAEWDVMEVVWGAGGAGRQRGHRGARRPSRVESEHDPHDARPAGGEGLPALPGRRPPLHLPSRRDPQAMHRSESRSFLERVFGGDVGASWCITSASRRSSPESSRACGACSTRGSRTRQRSEAMGNAPAILEVVGQSVWHHIVAGLRPGGRGAGGGHALARPALACLAVRPLVARLGPPAPAPGTPDAMEPVQPR